jgi:hypothetical protein
MNYDERSQDDIDNELFLIQQRKDDFTVLIKTEGGKRFIVELLETTGVLNLGYSPELSDMAYVQGRRSVGVALLNRIRIEQPKLLTELLAVKELEND